MFGPIYKQVAMIGTGTAFQILHTSPLEGEVGLRNANRAGELLRKTLSWRLPPSHPSPSRGEGSGNAILNCLIALAMTFCLCASPALAAGKPLTIVALGDSLTAGYLLGPDEGFVPQLQKALAQKGYDVTVENAGVSGDTSSGGLSRLDWAVGPGTDAVILELGANDALRGVDPKITRANLEAIVAKLKARKIPVLLAGMLSPPNMGADYAKSFNAIFPELASTNGLVFYPFFLDGVATHQDLILSDGLHPTAKGVSVIVARILPDVEKLIARAQAARAAH